QYTCSQPSALLAHAKPMPRVGHSSPVSHRHCSPSSSVLVALPLLSVLVPS
ncbi:unnamed protein product, partial [Urochloa humidicola]